MPTTSASATRTTARGRKTRAEILRAAIELLGARGYAGLTIAAVCERARVTPTSVYWHFGSKAGLMQATVDRSGGGHVQRIGDAVRRTPGGFGQRVDALIAAVRELVVTQPLGSLTGIAVLGEGRHATPELLDALRSARDREVARIADEFETLRPGRGMPSGTLAVVTIALTNYAALLFRLDRDEAEVDQVLAELREVLMRMDS